MPDENFNQYFNDNVSSVNSTISSGAGALAFGQGMQDEINSFRDAQFREADTMIGGVPSYAGVSAAAGQFGAVSKAEAGKGLIGQGALSGASLGASIGSFWPGFGTVIGGGIGAVAGAITGIFGKKKAKEEQTKATERAGENFRDTQENYNEDVVDYFDDVNLGRQEAQGERAYQRRLYGTNITDPFASIL